MSTHTQPAGDDKPHVSFFGKLARFFWPHSIWPRLATIVALVLGGAALQLLPAQGHRGSFTLLFAPALGQETENAETLLVDYSQTLIDSSDSGFLFSPLTIEPLGFSSTDPDIFIDDMIFDEEGNFFFAALAPLPRELIGAERKTVVVHTVAEGEVLSTIAEQYGITVNTLIWANVRLQNNPDFLKLGDTLTIPPTSGVLHTVRQGDSVELIAKKYQADPAQIIAFNALPADGALELGETVVVPGGRVPPPPPAPKPAQPKYAAADGETRSASGGLIRPASGRRVRGISRYHRGVDIANSCGTPVYAAANGVIVRADPTGWNGGFGKVVVIHHPNGTETLYGHGSIIYVNQGEQVAQGQLIMAMGTTGRSTGCHVHFEVHGGKNPF